MRKELIIATVLILSVGPFMGVVAEDVEARFEASINSKIMNVVDKVSLREKIENAMKGPKGGIRTTPAGFDPNHMKDYLYLNWFNESNFIKDHEEYIYWLNALNFSEDYHWLDVVYHTCNGDIPQMYKEELNLTYTQANPMNFSYPRTGKTFNAKFDEDLYYPVINLTINPMGLIRMGRPVGGRGKEINAALLVDTDGDYNIITREGTIEGVAAFDFDWSTPEVDPYVTKATELYTTGRQEEEFANGVGRWQDITYDGIPDVPGDIVGGRIFLLLWRTDQNPDDNDNRTADLFVYCGFTSKLSWIALPYRHALQVPVAKIRGQEEGMGFDEKGQPKIYEGDVVTFDASPSFDWQDDVGGDGIGWWDPDYTGPDPGEGNQNIDDGFPEGEPDYGEVDHLLYKWMWGTGIQGTGWSRNNRVVTHRFYLPRTLDPSVLYVIYNVTVMVMDPDGNRNSATIKVKIWRYNHPPIPKLYVNGEERDNITILVNMPVMFSGVYFDEDKYQSHIVDWDLNGDGIYEFQNSMIVDNYTYSEPGDYLVTFRVFDGPKDDPFTKVGMAHVMVHVRENTPPVPIIYAKKHLAGAKIYNETWVKVGQTLYFNASDSYDPDNLPGFDINYDKIPEYHLQYMWKLGDGTRSEWTIVPGISHSYTDRGAPKVEYWYYPVTLTVSDGRDERTSEEFKVYVNLPPTAKAVSSQQMDPNTKIEVGDVVTFDGSGSYDPNDDLTYDGIRDKNYDDHLNYTWDFGDGSPKAYGMIVTHIYNSPGVYNVTLIVHDQDFTDEAHCMVKISPKNKLPVLRVKVRPETAYTNDLITFDATASYDPDGKAYLKGRDPLSDITIYWNFGDGTPIKQGAKITHMYEDNGVYNVTVTAIDADKDSVNTTLQITILNRAPVAVAKDVPPTILGDVVVFNAKASYDPDGNVVGYFWDYGDGERSDWVDTPLSTHQYSKPGKYRAKLLVKDNDGEISDPYYLNVTVLIERGGKEEKSIVESTWFLLLVIVLVLAAVMGIAYYLIFKRKPI
ncbi:MAG: PKD domain-containing protein [Thermoplasmata archaeon]|nr:PKD domain-containing protein [Thermoplasmata archaeon]